jgi:hypothetical protein
MRIPMRCRFVVCTLGGTYCIRQSTISLYILSVGNHCTDAVPVLKYAPAQYGTVRWMEKLKAGLESFVRSSSTDFAQGHWVWERKVTEVTIRREVDQNESLWFVVERATKSEDTVPTLLSVEVYEKSTGRLSTSTTAQPRHQAKFFGAQQLAPGQPRSDVHPWKLPKT